MATYGYPHFQARRKLAIATLTKVLVLTKTIYSLAKHRDGTKTFIMSEWDRHWIAEKVLKIATLKRLWLRNNPLRNVFICSSSVKNTHRYIAFLWCWTSTGIFIFLMILWWHLYDVLIQYDSELEVDLFKSLLQVMNSPCLLRCITQEHLY